jgi:hypothetical protein
MEWGFLGDIEVKRSHSLGMHLVCTLAALTAIATVTGQAARRRNAYDKGRARAFSSGPFLLRQTSLAGFLGEPAPLGADGG